MNPEIQLDTAWQVPRYGVESGDDELRCRAAATI